MIRLEENGGTALGPALYFSVLLAARKPGGQVLLCTDGAANVGLGRLDLDDDELKISEQFYENIISLAIEKGYFKIDLFNIYRFEKFIQKFFFFKSVRVHSHS